MNQAFITVIMPVRNEARFIAETINQLLRQDYPTDLYEIIVADGMSDDGTNAIVLEMAKQHPQVRLLENPKQFSSAGRNIGFRNGKGEIFVVIDGHCYIPDENLLGNIADCFEKSGADCLGRPQPLDPPGLTKFQKSVALARESRLGHGGDSLIFGEYEGFASPVSNGAAYTRHVFDRVGYVDENFDAAEDVEFNYRVEQAGLSCYTSPKIAIKYYPRESLAGLFRQMTRYGRGRRRFTRKHHQAITFNQLIPAAFVLGLCALVTSFVLYVFSGFVVPLILTALPYSLYLLLLAGATIRVAIRDGVQYAIPVPIILFVIHFGLGYGFLKEATQ